MTRHSFSVGDEVRFDPGIFERTSVAGSYCVVKLLPPDGVYAVRVQTPQGPFGGMLNLGPRPTFGDAERRIEAHVFDASHDWYGAPIRIDFLARLRDTRAFEGMPALMAQLAEDEAQARAVLTNR